VLTLHNLVRRTRALDGVSLPIQFGPFFSEFATCSLSESKLLSFADFYPDLMFNITWFLPRASLSPFSLRCGLGPLCGAPRLRERDRSFSTVSIARGVYEETDRPCLFNFPFSGDSTSRFLIFSMHRPTPPLRLKKSPSQYWLMKACRILSTRWRTCTRRFFQPQTDQFHFFYGVFMTPRMNFGRSWMICQRMIRPAGAYDAFLSAGAFLGSSYPYTRALFRLETGSSEPRRAHRTFKPCLLRFAAIAMDDWLIGNYSLARFSGAFQQSASTSHARDVPMLLVRDAHELGGNVTEDVGRFVNSTWSVGRWVFSRRLRVVRVPSISIRSRGGDALSKS